MSDEAMEILVASYPSEYGGQKALQKLQDMKKSGRVKFEDAAVLIKGIDGKLLISETADKGFGRGAVIGGVAGAAVGILAGPVGWAALGGAAVGGLAAQLQDGGFPDESLRKIGDEMPSGSSALIATIVKPFPKAIETALEEGRVAILTQEVGAEVSDGLNESARKAQE